MNLNDEMIENSRWVRQAKNGLAVEKFSIWHHPRLCPNNPWLWKFIPGVLVGFVGCLLLFSKRIRNRGSRDNYADFNGASASSKTTSTTVPTVDVKLMLVVNGELKAMKPGKMGAQCGHAAGLVMKKLMSRHRALLAQWESCGTKKICVKALSTQHLESLSEQASSQGILVTPVFDAGKTQVAEGSLTVVAIGPAEATKLHPITGDLKLMS